MVLPLSAPLSMDDIQGEFGGSNPTSLEEYYRGGGLVPDTPANAGIPTAGTVSILDFLGGDVTVDTDAPTLAVFKTGDESRTNDTISADPDLQFVSLPAGKYIIEGYLNVASATTTSPANMTIEFSTGTLTNSFFMMPGYGSRTSVPSVNDVEEGVGATFVSTYNNIQTVNVEAVFTGVGYTFRGGFESTTTATFSINWAQSTTNGSNATIMRDGSWLKLWEVA